METLPALEVNEDNLTIFIEDFFNILPSDIWLQVTNIDPTFNGYGDLQ